MYNPEVKKAFLACLHSAPTAEQKTLLETISVETWEIVVKLALQHQIGPFLRSRLINSHLDAQLPAASADRLQQAHHVTAYQNLKLGHELRILLDVFQEAGIPVVVLKGTVLAHLVYKNIALRAIADIDLLVQEGDLTRVTQILRDMGYQSRKPKEKTQAHMGRHLAPFDHPDKIAPVEVHWRLFHLEPLASISMSDLWARAVPIALVNSSTLTLSPEDLLLHICCHATYAHRLNHDIRFLVDIAMIIKHFQATLNWQVFAERARAWQCSRGVYMTLYLAQQFLGAAVPAEYLTMLAPEDAEEFPLEDFETLYFTYYDSTLRATGETYTQVMSEQRVFHKLRLLLQRILLPRRDLGLIYGIQPESMKIYLYYVVRAKDLIRRYFDGLPAIGPDLVDQLYRQQELLHWLNRDDA